MQNTPLSYYSQGLENLQQLRDSDKRNYNTPQIEESENSPSLSDVPLSDGPVYFHPVINAHPIAKRKDDQNDPLTSDEDLGHPVEKPIVSDLSSDHE